MTENKGWRGVVVLLFIAVLACPMLGQSPAGKIKVIVENASLRVKPSMDAEVLEEIIPVATVFNVEKKAGEWYEVKYQSKLGVMITGYIHEMYVEVLPSETGAKPVETPKKVEPKPATMAPQSFAPGIVGGHKLELGLGFGMGFGSFLPATSSAAYSWGPVGSLLRVDESIGVGHSVKNPLGLGFSLTYFVSGGFGLKARIDMNFKQSIESATSDYSLTWTWNRPVNPGPFTQTADWPVTGDISIMPISLDLVYKFSLEGAFQPYVNAGVSYFTGTANLSTTTGWGVTFLSGGYRYIDYLAVPLKVESASLSSVGFNAGLGLDLFFSPNIGLNLDAAYFFGKAIDVTWVAVGGTYPTNMNPGFNINASDLSFITEHLGTFQVKTSFFKIMAGVKIGF
jgi:opacity protein-like surface antigen